MNVPDDQKMRELAWRRPLTGAEAAELEAFLAKHPAERADWELENELNRLLEQLPEAPPVASNFTARVMSAVEHERSVAARRRATSRWFPIWNWVPRAAMAMLVVGLSCFAYLQHQAHARAAMAENVAQITEIVSASDPAVMENFEAIRRMGDSQPQADAELLALLK
jgi:anti-sigma factor RsiW